jgi:hypothetical protein
VSTGRGGGASRAYLVAVSSTPHARAPEVDVTSEPLRAALASPSGARPSIWHGNDLGLRLRKSKYWEGWVTPKRNWFVTRFRVCFADVSHLFREVSRVFRKFRVWVSHVFRGCFAMFHESVAPLSSMTSEVACGSRQRR